ncbi:MAG: YwaF family protein [Oscillospiraceae bacterium]|nr:YwaF family protein [Oscillospiraceae bacterium]
MWSFGDLIRNFFTHKDFLPPASMIPGTLFSPLHWVVAACLVALVVGLCLWVRKVPEERLKKIYTVLWAFMVVLEIGKICWEACAGKTVRFEWTGVLPLYPCSVFMYVMPFAIWGSGYVRKAVCGYVCTLGLLGGAINFVYPANVLNNYSAISFAGVQTLFYHGALVFCAVSMLISGYHSFRGVKNWWELLLPVVPMLPVSVVANLVNFSPVGSDYMFFKLESFFFAPIGAATPDWLGVVIVYLCYMVIHGLPYLPSYLAGRRSRCVG